VRALHHHEIERTRLRPALGREEYGRAQAVDEVRAGAAVDAEREALARDVADAGIDDEDRRHHGSTQ
jgi:hypothetical protein